MPAIGGVARHGNHGMVERDLDLLAASLHPFGEERRWIGRIGQMEVGLATFGGSLSRTADDDASAGPVVVADSHLIDRQRVADRLGIDRQADDATLASHASTTWGESFLDHLDGTFALAVADPRTARVVVARDHAGARPLCIFEGQGLVAFASHPLALALIPEIGHDLDDERALESLIGGHSGERTFVRNVRTVDPGSMIQIAECVARTRRWWTPSTRLRHLGALEAYASEVLDAISTATAHAVSSSDRPGVLLSGGLDSSSVAALAARHIDPQPLRTYTHVPPHRWQGVPRHGWVPNERPEVEALAARYANIHATFVPSRTRELFNNEMLWELGAPPLRNPMAFGPLIDAYRDAAADGIDVLLNGNAGNYGFSAGGDFWLVQLARRGRLLRLRREARAWSERNGIPLPYVYNYYLVKRAFPRLIEWRRRRHGYGTLKQNLLAGAVLPERLAAVDLDRVVDRVISSSNIASDPPDVFRSLRENAGYTAAVEVLFGFRQADPTADRRLLELTMSQPDWWRNHDGVWRAIPRAAMRDVLPPEIVDRREVGEQIPDWVDRLVESREQISTELDAMRDHPASRELIDIGSLETLFARLPAPEKRNDMWTMLRYREALMKSISISKYMRWFDERAERVRTGGPAVIMHDPFAEFG